MLGQNSKDETTLSKAKKQAFVKFWYTNARSLNNKLNEFQTIMSQRSTIQKMILEQKLSGVILKLVKIMFLKWVYAPRQDEMVA